MSVSVGGDAQGATPHWILQLNLCGQDKSSREAAVDIASRSGCRGMNGFAEFGLSDVGLQRACGRWGMWVMGYRWVFLEKRYLIVMKKRRLCNSIAMKAEKFLFHCFAERKKRHFQTFYCAVAPLRATFRQQSWNRTSQFVQKVMMSAKL